MSSVKSNSNESWGWVIVTCVFFIRFLSATYDGIGLYLVFIMHEFGRSKSEVSLIASLCFSLQNFLGPAVGFLHDRYGARKVVFVGNFVMATCLIASAFAPSLLYLYLVYGIIGGFGLALNYLPTMVIISHYFDKKLGLATSLGMVGAFFGTFTLPHLTRFLIGQYGWRGSLLLSGAVALNALALSFALRPPPSQLTANETEKEKIANAESSKPDMGKDAESGAAGLSRFDSIGELYDRYFLKNLFVTPSEMTVFTPNEMPVSLSFDDTRLSESDSDASASASVSFPSLRSYLDLLRDPQLAALVLANSLSVGVVYVPSVYIVDWGTQLGIEAELTTTFLSLVGLGSLIGRPTMALVSDFFPKYRTALYTALLFILGSLTAVLPFFANRITLGILVFQFTIFLGGSQSLLAPVLAEMLPLSKMAKAFGLVLAGNGFAIFLGPPLMGLLPNYQLTFTVSGLIVLSAAFVMLFSRLLRCRSKTEVTEKK